MRDETRVREWRDVRRDDKSTGEKAHVGRVFCICVKKHAELPVGDPKRKYKGRSVFGGDRVYDDDGNMAIPGVGVEPGYHGGG